MAGPKFGPTGRPAGGGPVLDLLGIAFLAATAVVVYMTFARASAADIEEAWRATEVLLVERDLTKGLPIYIRIFKEESALELWMADRAQDPGEPSQWRLLRTFPICAWSGRLGPKLKEGDHQSPEGFYRVGKSSLNPNSRFHLSFNLGFPNAYDRAHGRTGSFLMVHGNCVSVGCYAMTDPFMEVIYRLVEAALLEGQPHVPVHIFPFRMTEENLHKYRSNPWTDFWREIKPAYDAFEKNKQPPSVLMNRNHYEILT